MALSQNERNKKYKNKFTRPEIKIPKDIYSSCKDYVLQKGYTGLNDYVNAALMYDMLVNCIPNRQDIQEYIKQENKQEEI